MAKKRYTKLEEEIIQILDEKEREPGWKRLKKPRMPSRSRSRPRNQDLYRTPASTSGRVLDRGSLTWLGGTFGLALAAILVADWSSLLAGLLAIASILFFLSPMVTSRRIGPPSRPTSQRWRGKDVDFPPPRAGVLGELRYRIWKIRRR